MAGPASAYFVFMRSNMIRCFDDAGLMALLRFCGFHGPVTFLLALVAAILVLKFPGREPHVYLHNDHEDATRLQNWISPGVRIICMLAAQLRILSIAFRCMRTIWSLQPPPGQLCISQTLCLSSFQHSSPSSCCLALYKACVLPYGVVVAAETSALPDEILMQLMHCAAEAWHARTRVSSIAHAGKLLRLTCC